MPKVVDGAIYEKCETFYFSRYKDCSDVSLGFNLPCSSSKTVVFLLGNRVVVFAEKGNGAS